MAIQELIQVQTTVDSVSKAAELSDKLLEARLAACVQISSTVTSCYRWEGDVQRAEEIVLAIKSTRRAWPALSQLLAEIHPYEEPQIIALPIVEATDSFAQWVTDEVEGN